MQIRNGNQGRRGFSLIELVIVVVIIGIIGAIAIPRMSRGAAGATDSSLKANLAVLRNAVDLYAAEHGGTYPTLLQMQEPSFSESGAGNPLLDYTNAAGVCNATGTAEYIFGPYLRAIPTRPVDVPAVGTDLFAAAGGTSHWAYDEDTGKVWANTTASDVKTIAYSNY